MGRSKRVWWKCIADANHEWSAALYSRLKNKCPYCSLTPQSRQELIILFELKYIFRDIRPSGHKLKVNGKIIPIDIFIPYINLCVEFDGSYWHKEKIQVDIAKTKQLLEAGFNVIRIREVPLEPIFENDIESKQPFDGKKIVDDLLEKIMQLYTLDKQTKIKIYEYLDQDRLQNEKELEAYITRILRDKAKKE